MKRKRGVNNLRLRKVFYNMKTRCYDINSKDYKYYGERGIYICDEWITGNTFPFIEWALLNGYEKGLQIDRIDNNKPYSPENCRFVTRVENMRNQRTNRSVKYRGEIFSTINGLIESKIIDVLSRESIRSRIKRGWDIEKAIDTPIRQGNYNKNKYDSIISIMA